MIDIEKFKHMPAQKYYDAKSIHTASAEKNKQDMINDKDHQYIITRKNDGEWSMFIKDDNGNITVRSRSISKVTNEYGDFTAKIPHLVKEFSEHFGCGTVLLGELCFLDPSKTSKDVGTILRCLPEKAIERQKDNPLYLKIFDCLAFNGRDITNWNYCDRFNIVIKLIDYAELKYISATDSATNDFTTFVDKIWSEGGEGAVIQRIDNKYEPGLRTAWHTLKIKKTLGEIEVPVIAVLPPTYEYTGDNPNNWQYKDSNGKLITKFAYYGWAGAIQVDYHGVSVAVSSGLSDEDREYLTSTQGKQDIEKHNLVAVINAMEEDSVSGSLRHPIVIRLRNKENM
jgi:hypothetical protein